MRKIIVILCSLVLVLSACGGEKQAVEGDGQLSFVIWDETWRPAFQEIIDEFESLHEGVEITLEVVPFSSYWTKMDTMATTGQGADLFIMNAPNIIKYQESDMLAELDDTMAANDVNPDDFVDGTFDAYQVDGKTYAVPFDYDVTMLYYNKDILEAAGAKVPTTWDEVMTEGQKILDYDSSLYPYVMSGNQAGYWPVIVSNGGEIIKEDGSSGYEDQVTMDSLNWLVEAVENNIIPKTSSIEGTNPIDILMSGKAAFAQDGSWMIPAAVKESDLNLGVATIPSTTDNKAGIIHAPAVAVNSQSDDVEIAKEFAAFIGSDFAQEKVASTMNQLPAKQGFNDVFIENNKKLPELADVLEYTGTAATYPATVSGDWETKELEAINKMLNLEESPEEAAEETTTAINASNER